MTEKTKYVEVKAEFRSGEQGIPFKDAIKVAGEDAEKEPDEIAEDYFSDFFGDGTRVDGNRFWARFDEAVVKVNSSREITEEEYVIINR